MFRKFLPLALLGLFAVGCGKSTKVECEVTMDGKPVEGATVVFVPKEGKGSSASGVTDSSGKCAVKLPGGKDAIPAGEYNVTITKTKSVAGFEKMKPGSPEYVKAMKERETQAKAGSELPGKYGDAKTSGLTAKVPPSSHKFELKK